MGDRHILHPTTEQRRNNKHTHTHTDHPHEFAQHFFFQHKITSHKLWVYLRLHKTATTKTIPFFSVTLGMWSRRRQKYLYRSGTRLGLGKTHFSHCFAFYLVQRVTTRSPNSGKNDFRDGFYFTLSAAAALLFIRLHFSRESKDPTLFKNNLYPNGRLQQTMLIQNSNCMRSIKKMFREEPAFIVKFDSKRYERKQKTRRSKVCYSWLSRC